MQTIHLEIGGSDRVVAIAVPGDVATLVPDRDMRSFLKRLPISSDESAVRSVALGVVLASHEVPPSVRPQELTRMLMLHGDLDTLRVAVSCGWPLPTSADLWDGDPWHGTLETDANRFATCVAWALDQGLPADVARHCIALCVARFSDLSDDLQRAIFRATEFPKEAVYDVMYHGREGSHARSVRAAECLLKLGADPCLERFANNPHDLFDDRWDKSRWQVFEMAVDTYGARIPDGFLDLCVSRCDVERAEWAAARGQTALGEVRLRTILEDWRAHTTEKVSTMMRFLRDLESSKRPRRLGDA